jgi:hypothetical protein
VTGSTLIDSAPVSDASGRKLRSARQRQLADRRTGSPLRLVPSPGEHETAPAPVKRLPTRPQNEPRWGRASIERRSDEPRLLTRVQGVPEERDGGAPRLLRRVGAPGDRNVVPIPQPDRRDEQLRALRATDLVRPASQSPWSSQLLPTLEELRPLLPASGLRRGSTVAVRSASVLLALLAEASRAGSWCAVVGLPALNPVAAAEMGLALDRLALVPHPSTEWTTAVGALLDGFDIVVAAPPGPVAPTIANRLAARARQRGSVLMPAGPWVGEWPGADLTVEAVRGKWSGLGTGHGRLRGRELTVRAAGRGAASAPKQVTVWLPAPTSVIPGGVAGDKAPPSVVAAEVAPGPRRRPARVLPHVAAQVEGPARGSEGGAAAGEAPARDFAETPAPLRRAG